MSDPFADRDEAQAEHKAQKPERAVKSIKHEKRLPEESLIIDPRPIGMTEDAADNFIGKS
ncbi:hypothetical protein [Asaia sp. HN010]|uniref:hypothetical protein n=1 Tax=Asaia sp. HN010 TaxID=3081233 RepID=UPI0030179797